ncbi:MAG: cell division FtsA domain-containing protein [Leptospiraceae bacterium]|nr:pilus assembly protein PilM [Leptospiraceae bacterium]MCK6379843.1 cell division FtsA domain-containing protein [Leptospiraceae bacterium]NUM41657.1 pilus assembly protein PilM [Leptospiraceae bacterium]
MFFDQYLAIDYGTTFIKGILYKQFLGGVTILRNETLKIVRLEESEGDEYEYNIVRFIQSFFPEETNFLINLPIEKLFIRDLVVPLGTEKAVREIIPFEVENQIPFPVETMEVLGNIWKIEDENSNVITFSAHHSELQKAITPFLRTETQLKSMSIDSFVLSSVITKHQGGAIHSEKVGQVDIGGKITIFNSISDGKLTHSRFFAAGGEYITQKISDLLKIELHDAEELKTSITFNINEIDEDLKQAFLKKFKLTNQNFKQLLQILHSSLDEVAEEVARSIFALFDSEKPEVIYLSGGGSLLPGTEKFLSDKIGISVKKYDFLELKEESYTTCLGTGYHYLLKKSEKMDFLNTKYVQTINKSSLKLSYFKTHLALLGISFFILITVFFVGIIIDKRKIKASNELLAQKFQSGFGMEAPSDTDVMDFAVREVKKEQKNSEIVRLFLSQDSILDILVDLTNNFPSKDSFNFALDQFTFDGNEVQIYGRVDEFSELGTIQSSLEKSKKFKNIEVLNKRLIQGVSKLKVSFKIKLEVVNSSEKNNNNKSDSNAE